MHETAAWAEYLPEGTTVFSSSPYHLSALKLLDAGRYQTPSGIFNYHDDEVHSTLP